MLSFFELQVSAKFCWESVDFNIWPKLAMQAMTVSCSWICHIIEEQNICNPILVSWLELVLLYCTNDIDGPDNVKLMGFSYTGWHPNTQNLAAWKINACKEKKVTFHQGLPLGRGSSTFKWFAPEIIILLQVSPWALDHYENTEIYNIFVPYTYKMWYCFLNPGHNN